MYCTGQRAGSEEGGGRSWEGRWSWVGWKREKAYFGMPPLQLHLHSCTNCNCLEHCKAVVGLELHTFNPIWVAPQVGCHGIGCTGLWMMHISMHYHVTLFLDLDCHHIWFPLASIKLTVSPAPYLALMLSSLLIIYFLHQISRHSLYFCYFHEKLPVKNARWNFGKMRISLALHLPKKIPRKCHKLYASFLN